MTLESLVYFALGCFVGSFAVIGLGVFAAMRGKRRRSRRSAHRRTATHTA